MDKLSICLLCQRKILTPIDWQIVLKMYQMPSYCQKCIEDKKMLEQAHKDYIERNYYHLKEYIAQCLQKTVDVKKYIVLTIPYPRECGVLYDETYAIMSQLTKHCYSLCQSKLNLEKVFHKDCRHNQYKKRYLVVSYIPLTLKQKEIITVSDYDTYVLWQ